MEIKIIGPDDPALAVTQAAIQAHPEWHVQLTFHPWAEYRNVLMGSLSAPVSPHQAVFVPGHVWIPELAQKKLIAPLDKWMVWVSEESRKKYQAQDLLESVTEEGAFGGHSYMIAIFTDGHILFYRSDLVDPGQNQAVPVISPFALAELAAGVHKPPSVYGLALKAHPSEILFDWLPFLLEAGGQVLDASLQPAFASAAGVRALKEYCRLRLFCPADTHTYGNSEIANVLREGKAALVTTWGGQAAPIFLDEKNPYRRLYKAGVYPHPCGGTWGIAIPANQPEKSQKAALQVALDLNGPAQDLEIILKAGSPVRKTSYSPQALGQYSWLNAQYEMMKRINWLPKQPQVGLVLGPLTEALSRAFTGEMDAEGSLALAERATKELLAG
jgi:multiple sugar transport system substrate-binding protein